MLLFLNLNLTTWNANYRNLQFTESRRERKTTNWMLTLTHRLPRNNTSSRNSAIQTPYWQMLIGRFRITKPSISSPPHDWGEPVEWRLTHQDQYVQWSPTMFKSHCMYSSHYMERHTRKTQSALPFRWCSAWLSTSLCSNCVRKSFGHCPTGTVKQTGSAKYPVPCGGYSI